MPVVRRAALKDFEAILKLEKRYFGSPKENFESLFKLKTPNEECVFFVAEKNKKVIGYSRMHLLKWYEGAHIVTIVVDEKYRRKGYGTLLLKEMEKFARNKGMKIITLDTSPDKIEALIFYLRNGFRICGYRDKFEENGRPIIYLSKKLRET